MSSAHSKKLKIFIPKNKSGFTLAEIVLSVSILLMLSVTSVYYFTRGGESHALEKDRQGLIALMEEARSLTISGKDAAVYGVRVETEAAYLFEGDTYVANDPDNKIFQFHRAVYASFIDIAGGSDVTFRRLSGESSASGTVTLSLYNNGSVFKIVTILNTGVVQ